MDAKIGPAGPSRDQNILTILNADVSAGLGKLRIYHPPGTSMFTPATLIAIQAIGSNQQLITGKGIDWGSGTGSLAISASRINSVERIIGLDISAHCVEVARQNALINGVEDEVEFILSDSYTPLAEADKRTLDVLRGQINFVLANPPASEGDDGFEYRRLILEGARSYLVPGGVVFLNISYQHGQQRVKRLTQQVSGFDYGGLLASTDWVPFDLRRIDLLHCLENYAEEESRGGLRYVFASPEVKHVFINARTALANFQRSGISPLTRWQTHLFKYCDI